MGLLLQGIRKSESENNVLLSSTLIISPDGVCKCAMEKTYRGGQETQNPHHAGKC